MHVIGLMSGTSVDGIDGVLLRFDAAGRPVDTLAGISIGLPAALRDAIHALQRPGPGELALSAEVARNLADEYARCANGLMREAGVAAADVAAIGAHGQTVRHRPADGYTIQLLDGARLAERTGVDVVCDLRSADVAAGGQGAPLLPAFHAEVFAAADPACRRAIVNLGGISNLTLLVDGAVTGFDCGPANTLLDQWYALHHDDGRQFDDGGRWAAQGRCDDTLLAAMLNEPFFRQPPPKSSGRDLFDLAWLRQRLARASRPDMPAQDVQATLVELCARTVADAARPARLHELYACGGGVRNAFLMQRLAACCGVAVITTQALGVEPQFVEAAGFAWLAGRRLNGLPGNRPSVTGAAGLRVLGALHARPPG